MQKSEAKVKLMLLINIKRYSQQTHNGEKSNIDYSYLTLMYQLPWKKFIQSVINNKFSQLSQRGEV